MLLDARAVSLGTGFFDSRYVLKTGDTMTGKLIVSPNTLPDAAIEVSGTTSLYGMNFTNTITPSANSHSLRAASKFDPQAAGLTLSGITGASSIGGSSSNAVSAFRVYFGQISITDSYGGAITDLTSFLAPNVNNTSSGAPSATNHYGFRAQNFSFATNSYGFRSELTAGATKWNLHFSGAAQNYMQGSLGIGIETPVVKLDVQLADTVNNAVTDMLQLTHERTGATAGTTGMGTGVLLRSESATNATFREQVRLTSAWATATDASRKARGILTAWDTAERECIRWEASGTAPMLGFYASAAVAKQTVTGSRGGNAALADLLTKLATLGLIIDGSS